MRVFFIVYINFLYYDLTWISVVISTVSIKWNWGTFMGKVPSRSRHPFFVEFVESSSSPSSSWSSSSSRVRAPPACPPRAWSSAQPWLWTRWAKFQVCGWRASHVGAAGAPPPSSSSSSAVVLVTVLFCCVCVDGYVCLWWLSMKSFSEYDFVYPSSYIYSYLYINMKIEIDIAIYLFMVRVIIFFLDSVKGGLWSGWFVSGFFPTLMEFAANLSSSRSTSF